MRMIKTPLQVRCEAERRGRPPAPPLPEPDRSKRPSLAPEPPQDFDATLDWLAHLAAGRIITR